VRQVRLRQKSRVVAYRDFGRKFEFIAGDFKPTAYHARARSSPVKLFNSWQFLCGHHPVNGDH
jgi:hypothetical protein